MSLHQRGDFAARGELPEVRLPGGESVGVFRLRKTSLREVPAPLKMTVWVGWLIGRGKAPSPHELFETGQIRHHSSFITRHS